MPLTSLFEIQVSGKNFFKAFCELIFFIVLSVPSENLTQTTVLQLALVSFDIGGRYLTVTFLFAYIVFIRIYKIYM